MSALTSIAKWGFRGLTGLGSVLGIGALAVSATGSSTVKDIASTAKGTLGEGLAQSAVGERFQGIGEFLRMCALWFQQAFGRGPISDSIVNFAERVEGKEGAGGMEVFKDGNQYSKHATYGPDGTPNFGGPDGGSTPGGPGDNGGGSGWGGTALGIGAGAATLGGAAWGIKRLRGGAAAPSINAADDALSIMQKAQIGDDVARGASRFGRWGKIAAIGATVIGGGMALLGGSPAEAATIPGGGATVAAGTGSIAAAGADIAGAGLSIVGANAAVQAAAPLAASLGVKAIPGVASIYAAGEAIYNTTSYALKGEWGKAGLSVVSGVGETVAGLGGAATYLTIGTAWREAVRAGGAAVLGEENTIEHSSVVQLGSWLKNQFFGATQETPIPEAQREYTASAQPAFAPVLGR